MDIRPNAKVMATDGKAGFVTRIILNPDTERVTHLVVDGPPAGPVLVPLQRVIAADDDAVHLDLTILQLTALDPFLEEDMALTQRPRPMSGDMSSYGYVAGPVPYADSTELVRVTHERVPEGELAIRPGAKVHATDGHVGEVHHFLVDLAAGQMTHFVLQEGHFWGRHEVQVPVSAISRTEEQEVYLTLSKAEISELTPVKAR
jgi:hypothetical protein